MTWQKKIEIGMTLIKEGCEQENKWSGCKGCPLGDVCDQLIDGARFNHEHWNEALFPDKWELVD